MVIKIEVWECHFGLGKSKVEIPELGWGELATLSARRGPPSASAAWKEGQETPLTSGTQAPCASLGPPGRRVCERRSFSCCLITVSAMKPCHSYLMILFKKLGLSSGPRMTQGGLHASLCPSGVMLRLTLGAISVSQAVGHDYWPEGCRLQRPG